MWFFYISYTLYFVGYLVISVHFYIQYLCNYSCKQRSLLIATENRQFLLQLHFWILIHVFLASDFIVCTLGDNNPNFPAIKRSPFVQFC